MWYGDKRESKVNICNALRGKGWNIFGYSPDQSDSMTDYYCPASWDGIAEKNGFVVCVDVYNNSNSGKEIYEYTKESVSNYETSEKINKLRALANDSAATEGEKQNALLMIEKLNNKVTEQEEEREATKVLKYKYPEYQKNPPYSNWHIEKNGKILDKGRGAFQFSSLPYEYDPETGKQKTWRSTDWTPNEQEQKEINKFESFVARINNIASGVANMGDGTEETESEGIEAEQKQGYEKIIVTETKTVTKPVKVDRTEIQKGDILSFSYHGGFWIVYDVWQNNKGVNCYSYEILGSAKRGYQRLKNAKRYYQTETRIKKDMEEGKVFIHEMRTFDESKEVEKWVKIDKSKKTTPKKEMTEKVNNSTTNEYTITADTDTRDNSALWVVKVVNKLSKEEYKKTAQYMKSINGYYSKFKHGFIFKYDPTSILLNNSTESQTNAETEENYVSIAESIIDKSTEIISQLQLTSEEYQTNEEYKKAIAEYLIINNITITESILDYIVNSGLNRLADVLKTIQAEQENPYRQPQIKDGFIYDCHFKEWNMSMNEIKEYVESVEIPFIDYGEKIGFKGITAEQIRTIKQISDINGSILFIDAETPKNDHNSEDITEQEEQQEDNMDDILGKFDDLEIGNTDRITASDKEFCEDKQKRYTEAISIMNNLVSAIKELSGLDLTLDKYYNQKILNEYIDPHYFKDISKIIDNMKYKFVHDITGYFTDKYKITINHDFMKKYDNTLTYENILDEIFIQLGGFSFTEKAEKEIKDALKEDLKYDIRDNRVKIKGNKLILNSFVWSSKGWNNQWEISYSSRGPLYKLFKALSHFETGRPETLNYYNNIIELCRENEAVFGRHELAYNSIHAVKIFKNGKLEVEFENNSQCQKFAKEYCGYITAEKVA